MFYFTCNHGLSVNAVSQPLGWYLSSTLWPARQASSTHLIVTSNIPQRVCFKIPVLAGVEESTWRCSCIYRNCTSQWKMSVVIHGDFLRYPDHFKLLRVQTSIWQRTSAFYWATVCKSLPSALCDNSLSLNTFEQKLKKSFQTMSVTNTIRHRPQMFRLTYLLTYLPKTWYLSFSRQNSGDVWLPNFMEF